jgi:hypothetical protein
MLDVDGWSDVRPIKGGFLTIWDSVHGKDISVFSDHFVSFNWIAILGYYKWLKKIINLTITYNILS